MNKVQRTTREQRLSPLFVICLVACNATNQPDSSGDGGADASDSAITEAGAADSGPVACTTTLDAYCAQPSSQCVRQWADVAPGPAQWCNNAWGGDQYAISKIPCDDYDEVISTGADLSVRFFYQHATVELVAVTVYAGGDRICWGGPSMFLPPRRECMPGPELVASCSPGDAGQD